MHSPADHDLCSDHCGDHSTIWDLPHVPLGLKREWLALETRRHFLGRGVKALGAAGLATLLGRTAPDPADPMTRALLGRFPESGGFRVSCFVSDQPLPCREGPRTGLRLKRGDGEWMEPLPSPPVQNLCLVGDQPGLFHVLTRIAKP